MKRFRVGILIAIVAVLAMQITILQTRVKAQTASQYPIADKLADKIIQKYQTSTCQQLAQQKQQHPTGEKAAMEQKVIEALRNDPQMRQHFINRIAAPIANKMFECGFIP
jgi:hypothetical protein